MYVHTYIRQKALKVGLGCGRIFGRPAPVVPQNCSRTLGEEGFGTHVRKWSMFIECWCDLNHFLDKIHWKSVIVTHFIPA